MYLYSCHAGKRLSRYFDGCEVFGHQDVVPMPEVGANDVVMQFLDEVHALMGEERYDREEWRARLASYVNARLADAAEREDGFRDVLTLYLLRKSLGFYDE